MKINKIHDGTTNDEIVNEAATIAFLRPTTEGDLFATQVVRDFEGGPGWRVAGMGLAGMGMQPYTDREVLEMLSAATRIMWQIRASSDEAFQVDR